MRRWIAGALALTAVTGTPVQASLTRNAAGAKNMGEPGMLTIDTAFERESDADGSGWILETAVQYQVADRLQLLLEAVPFERQSPEGEEVVEGIGDTDVTVSWLTLPDAPVPVVLGAKVKLPTAGEDLGTGKADFSALLILGYETGELEVSLETEFATLGEPDDGNLRDQFLYTLSAEYGLNDFLAVYAEAFGNSSPVDGESRTDAALVGLEADVPLGEPAAPYVSLEADTEETVTLRVGLELAW